jgi:hypothetical protein
LYWTHRVSNLEHRLADVIDERDLWWRTALGAFDQLDVVRAEIKRLQADLAAERAEVERLRRWKDEATIVLTEWNSVADPIIAEMDFDDTIGRRKTDIVADALAAERALDDRLIAALRSDLAAERALADQLAEALDRHGSHWLCTMLCSVCVTLAAHQEARHER